MNAAPVPASPHDVNAVARTFPSIAVNPHVHLSEFRPSDRKALLEHLKDRDFHEHTLRIPHPFTTAHADEWLARLAKPTEAVATKWAIRRSDGYLIGGIGFDDRAMVPPGEARIGYWLAKPYWGQGIMTEVVRAVCEHAFRERKLAKITADVFAFNAGSARVLEKCGFAEEAYLPKHYVEDGRSVDVRRYALSAWPG